jgi:hypothetical protein
VLLPAFVLARCLSKQRSRNRSDYWDKTLTTRVDTHLRSYCQVRAATGHRPKKRKGKNSEPPEEDA